MNPLQLKFEYSAPNTKSLPEDVGSEVISIGYSNVGKSSFINAIANERNLAKCSKTPGRTQLFNIFSVNQDQRIIDLPGYGFAKAPKAQQALWKQNLQTYLSQRLCLKGIILVTDIRRGLKPIDEDIVAWAKEHNMCFLIILNKADKLSKNETQKAVSNLKQYYHIEEHEFEVCSCTKKTGIDTARKVIKAWLEGSV